MPKPPRKRETVEAVGASLPKAIRLTRVHSFIDQDGTHRRWTINQVVDQPETVALLIERGAHYEITE